MGKPLRIFYGLGSSLALLVLTACGSAPPPPRKYPIPVPAAELARLLPGHFIALGPLAPCDAGPLTFPSAGKFVAYNGFGSAEGTYQVHDGAVELDGNMGGTRYQERIRFARDARGTLLHAFPDNELSPVTLEPLGEDAPAITCHAS